MSARPTAGGPAPGAPAAGLGSRSLALIRLSAALASGRPDALRAALAHAAEAADPAEVEEALLQSYLFLGYPAALNAFALWREHVPEAAAPAQPERPQEWEERGMRVCATVYGGQYERLRQNMRRLHPDMERWMLREGYGKVLARPGLDLAIRELCIVALLAGLPAEPQLYAHLRGALHAGAPPADVEAALEEAGSVLDLRKLEAARAVWRRVQARREG